MRRTAPSTLNRPRMARDVALHRLVLWNVDHTLVDVGRVTREAYAEAFQKATGRPLVRLAPTAGRTESEIIFETLAFNDVVTTDDHLAGFMTRWPRRSRRAASRPARTAGSCRRRARPSPPSAGCPT